MISALPYEAIVIGASAGGMKIIRDIVTGLPADFSMAVIIVQHVADSGDDVWARILDGHSQVHVKEADEKEKIEAGHVYLAPANYHLLVEPDKTFTLTLEERVNYARPSIDVLFDTAADAYRKKLIGILCTGANFDGARGLRTIKECGGLTIVQDPATAEAPAMPKSAIQISVPDFILSPHGIVQKLIGIHTQNKSLHEFQN